ncbi:hypothetical protein UNSW1_81 [Campylobacter concisus UNSW1]|nr:hypothetical protein UNSW1_81 [Campylobacter concisus UNSW1]
MKFNLAKPYKFQIFYHTFYISTFSHQKKQNLPIFLIKSYEILVVKFIQKFTD